jgi:hypothetical protein
MALTLAASTTATIHHKLSLCWSSTRWSPQLWSPSAKNPSLSFHSTLMYTFWNLKTIGEISNKLIFYICFYPNFSSHFRIKVLVLPFAFNSTACSLNPSLFAWHFNYFSKYFLFDLTL